MKIKLAELKPQVLEMKGTVRMLKSEQKKYYHANILTFYLIRYFICSLIVNLSFVNGSDSAYTFGIKIIGIR